MRAIKFRVWDNEKKTMEIAGAIDWCEQGGWLPITCNTKTKKLYQTYPGDSHCGFELIQFTGLLDRNGKEIYEGDIVLYPDTYTESVDVGIGMMPVAQTQENSFFPVEFKNGSFGIETKNSEILNNGWHTLEEVARETSITELGDTLEVIGNIYENPDLLTPAKQ